MSLDSDIALLRRVPLFVDLPTEQIRLLAFSAVQLELAPDQVLFREGARATDKREDVTLHSGRDMDAVNVRTQRQQFLAAQTQFTHLHYSISTT